MVISVRISKRKSIVSTERLKRVFSFHLYFHIWLNRWDFWTFSGLPHPYRELYCYLLLNDSFVLYFTYTFLSNSHTLPIEISEILHRSKLIHVPIREEIFFTIFLYQFWLWKISNSQQQNIFRKLFCHSLRMWRSYNMYAK